MRVFLATFIFFITFYKISIIFSYAYLILPIATVCLIFLFYKPHRTFILNSLGIYLVLLFIYILIYTFIIDIVSGALIQNSMNSFFIRTISMIVISLIPAYLFSIVIMGSQTKLIIKAISIAFYIQIFFWIITYLDPNIKILLTQMMGGSDNSVNLKSWNLETRGFGLSTEVNYTSPFMTVLVSFLFLRNYRVSILSSITQLINSNLVLIAISIGFLFSNFKIYIKLIIVLLFFIIITKYGLDLFPRLYAEFSSGDSRTINKLSSNHILFTATNSFEHLFGTTEYTFQGGSTVRSDIGWVNMYNYGGAFFILLYILILASLSISAFGLSWIGFIWLLSGCVLNFKGLLYGPNSFFFVTFICIFLKKSVGIPINKSR